MSAIDIPNTSTSISSASSSHDQLVQSQQLPENTSQRLKRPRSDTISVKIKNSESLYFPNGDIVLLSLPKDDVVTAFKVDRVFLLRASPVFEGMLELPSLDDVECHDNVPLVRLQDESEHLARFLNALYDSRCIPWKKHDADTVHIVEGILLLANKYQVDHLRERIINLLERDWPPTLSDWDINEGEIGVISDNLEGTFSIDTYTPEPCEAIRLARKCGVPSILPAAFYHLSRIRGTADRRLPTTARLVEEGERTADFLLLSVEDLRCLIVGRDAIFDVFKEYVDEATEKAIKHGHCSSSDPSECVRGLYKFGDQLEKEMLRNRDPLFLMKDGGSCFAWPLDTCDVCRGIYLTTLENNRGDFWRRLPWLFLLKISEF
ncbi:hypothetical protein Clacol_007898 [Clathrus columnatus]|uniref:BTB domain-containing protein n=1 Tax=Clathrus columnatus TaxID=1419009 RepID=A0AAV5AIQ6_9AGAM|nr:hypothetical protein Clacol_007898 [Clathrus columnatus]